MANLLSATTLLEGVGASSGVGVWYPLISLIAVLAFEWGSEVGGGNALGPQR